MCLRLVWISPRGETRRVLRIFILKDCCPDGCIPVSRSFLLKRLRPVIIIRVWFVYPCLNEPVGICIIGDSRLRKPLSAGQFLAYLYSLILVSRGCGWYWFRWEWD